MGASGGVDNDGVHSFSSFNSSSSSSVTIRSSGTVSQSVLVRPSLSEGSPQLGVESRVLSATALCRCACGRVSPPYTSLVHEFEHIHSSGFKNYQKCRRPVKSKLNI